jgi:hypothetical protein
MTMGLLTGGPKGACGYALIFGINDHPLIARMDRLIKVFRFIFRFIFQVVYAGYWASGLLAEAPQACRRLNNRAAGIKRGFSVAFKVVVSTKISKRSLPPPSRRVYIRFS